MTGGADRRPGGLSIANHVEPSQSRFPASCHPCWWVFLLLASLAGPAEATTCIEPPAVTVKEVEGLVILSGEAAEPVPGALVSLFKKTPTGWAVVAETMADAEGRFRMPEVRPGLYKIRWELEGLQSEEGRLRVRRFTRKHRGTLVLVLSTDLFGCGGWLELRTLPDSRPRPLIRASTWPAAP